MAKKKSTKQEGRTDWLDPASQAPLIVQYAERLGSFLEAMADGRIEAQELKAQEGRVVELMKSVEPKLDGTLHEEVTRLLCELSAYNIMRTLHQVMEAGPRTKFRG
jgi:hypothetical protein